jgi:hypothetical protein
MADLVPKMDYIVVLCTLLECWSGLTGHPFRTLGEYTLNSRRVYERCRSTV